MSGVAIMIWYDHGLRYPSMTITLLLPMAISSPNSSAGWTELLSRKDSISEELFQEDFAAWKTEIFEKAEQLDTMERIRNAKNAETI